MPRRASRFRARQNGLRLLSPSQIRGNRLFLANVTTPERGFRACAEGITSPRLKTVFEAAGQKCDGGDGGRDTEAAANPQPQHQVFDSRNGRTRGARRMRATRSLEAEGTTGDSTSRSDIDSTVLVHRSISAYGGRLSSRWNFRLYSVFVQLSEITAPSFERGLNATRSTRAARSARSGTSREIRHGGWVAS